MSHTYFGPCRRPGCGHPLNTGPRYHSVRCAGRANSVAQNKFMSLIGRSVHAGPGAPRLRRATVMPMRPAGGW